MFLLGGSAPEEKGPDWIAPDDTVEQADNVSTLPSQRALEVRHSYLPGPGQLCEVLQLKRGGLGASLESCGHTGPQSSASSIPDRYIDVHRIL